MRLGKFIVEGISLMYGFSTMAEMKTSKRERPWMAPKLFYVYGLPNSETSLERV